MKNLIVGLLFAAFAVSAAEFRVECENFTDLKSWVSQTDARAVEKGVIRSNQRGSSNAIKSTFACPEAGKYYIFVRTLDIGERSRKTTVKVNDVVMGNFGDDNKPANGKKSAYFWNKSANAIDLPVGDFTIELTPNNSYSRVDSIIFTTDADFSVPGTPRAAEEIDEVDAK